jgi:hypothetical protein
LRHARQPAAKLAVQQPAKLTVMLPAGKSSKNNSLHNVVQFIDWVLIGSWIASDLG